MFYFKIQDGMLSPYAEMDGDLIDESIAGISIKIRIGFDGKPKIEMPCPILSGIPSESIDEAADKALRKAEEAVFAKDFKQLRLGELSVIEIVKIKSLPFSFVHQPQKSFMSFSVKPLCGSDVFKQTVSSLKKMNQFKPR